MIKRQKDKRKDVRIKRIIGDSKKSPLLVALPSLTFILWGSRQRNGYFTVRLTAAPSALTVSKSEDFDPLT